MAKFKSVEMFEHRYPLRFNYYAICEVLGGVGDPLERDLSAVHTDLKAEFINSDTATSVYGAVITATDSVGD